MRTSRPRSISAERGRIAALAVASLLVGAAAHALPGGRPSFEKPNIVPAVHDIAFRGSDAWLNGRFALPGGDLDAVDGWVIAPGEFRERRESTRLDPAAPPVGCVAPGVSPPAVADGGYGGEWRALACDGARWLFARDGYCPEGVQATGRVWLDGAEVALPRCHSPHTAALVGERAWVGTVRPVEKYEAFEGALVELVRGPGGAMTASVSLHGPVVTAIARDPAGARLWVGTTTGVHRQDLATGEWVQRHFRFRLRADGATELYLAAMPMPVGEYERWAPLLAFPQIDRRAFMHAWQAGEPVTAWYTYARSPALAALYRDAALAMLAQGIGDRWEAQNRFGQLLELAFGEHGLDADAQLAVLIKAFAAEPPGRLRVSLLRRVLALHAAGDAGVARAVTAAFDVPRAAVEVELRDALRLARPDPRNAEFKDVCRRLRADEVARTLSTTLAAEDERAARTLARCATPGDPLVVTPGVAGDLTVRSVLHGRSLSVEYSELLDPASLTVTVNGVDVSASFHPGERYSEFVPLPFVDGANKLAIRARSEAPGAVPFEFSTTIEYGMLRPQVSVHAVTRRFESAEEAEAYLECIGRPADERPADGC